MLEAFRRRWWCTCPRRTTWRLAGTIPDPTHQTWSSHPLSRCTAAKDSILAAKRQTLPKKNHVNIPLQRLHRAAVENIGTTRLESWMRFEGKENIGIAAPQVGRQLENIGIAAIASPAAENIGMSTIATRPWGSTAVRTKCQ